MVASAKAEFSVGRLGKLRRIGNPPVEVQSKREGLVALSAGGLPTRRRSIHLIHLPQKIVTASLHPAPGGGRAFAG